jgi:ferredoxin-type protein NapF
LHGKLSDRRQEIYPPWSIAPPQFLAQCTRCDACITRCPQHILSRNNLGYPVADFTRQGCTFCADCVDACETGSLSLMDFIGAEPWSVKAVITESCVNFKGTLCQMCSGSCVENAIKFSVRSGGVAIPEVDPLSCTGCGECYRSCPQKAIQVKPLNR